MIVQDVKYVKSALYPEDFPRDRRPEVAFIGRSNVGKSSLLNALLKRKGLAKTSSTPGKTQTINFFDVNGKIYFVDLPGYGYAKVPKSMKDAWNKCMMNYLQKREPLKLIVALMDGRHKPSNNDLHMLELLEEAEIPTIIIATKVDKLTKKERQQNVRRIEQILELEEAGCVLPFSSLTREGVKELWQVIDDVLDP